jgi:hypothetical protein
MLIARHGAVVGRTKAIGHLKALIVNAPQQLREQLRRGTTDQQLDAAPGCAQRAEETAGRHEACPFQYSTTGLD